MTRPQKSSGRSPDLITITIRSSGSFCANFAANTAAIFTTHTPAADLGYLLHNNPARLPTEELSFGRAHVFYPEANADLCTVAIMLASALHKMFWQMEGAAIKGGHIRFGSYFPEGSLGSGVLTIR
jgi:hypothetical protein